ncbi:MAG TPA: DUF1566 domain-containing protein [Myxococcota bacterium]|nr:MAG: hypothetical protein BWY95_02763 [Bacteroidetes bacterium ADurb.BinA104]HQC44419.1 DUF1566 domain-containing protein [Myxococcota bacterium]HQL56912.1 DUF1566 domain-containing protein [Myxococcota bacterium]
MHRFYITTAFVAAMFLAGCGDSNDDKKQSDRGPISLDYGQPSGDSTQTSELPETGDPGDGPATDLPPGDKDLGDRPDDQGQTDTAPTGDDGSGGDPSDTDTDPEPDLPPCDYVKSATGMVDNCDGSITDTTTGITWYKYSLSVTDVTSGLVACNSLNVGDKIGWRLATIDELRTIIRGCPATAKGGACPITNTNWQESNNGDANCNGCDMKQGPGDDGCYTDPWLNDQCHLVLSSTKVPTTTGSPLRAWYVTFYDAKIEVNRSGSSLRSAFARCVWYEQ